MSVRVLNERTADDPGSIRDADELPDDVHLNPFSGERLRIIEETPEICRFEVWAPPGSGVHEHVHEQLTETFEVLEGELWIAVDGEERVLADDEESTVPGGAAHEWKNVSNSEVHFVVSIRPGERIGDAFRDLFALAARGDTNTRGLGGFLQLVVLADEYPELGHPSNVPAPVFRGLVRVFATVGRLLGYRIRYD